MYHVTQPDYTMLLNVACAVMQFVSDRWMQISLHNQSLILFLCGIVAIGQLYTHRVQNLQETVYERVCTKSFHLNHC